MKGCICQDFLRLRRIASHVLLRQNDLIRFLKEVIKGSSYWEASSPGQLLLWKHFLCKYILIHKLYREMETMTSALIEATSKAMGGKLPNVGLA